MTATVFTSWADAEAALQPGFRVDGFRAKVPPGEDDRRYVLVPAAIDDDEARALAFEAKWGRRPSTEDVILDGVLAQLAPSQ